MTAAGWYQDPFGQHEHRWFSAGEPTKLVRDHDVERAGAEPGDGVRKAWDLFDQMHPVI